MASPTVPAAARTGTALSPRVPHPRRAGPPAHPAQSLDRPGPEPGPGAADGGSTDLVLLRVHGGRRGSRGRRRGPARARTLGAGLVHPGQAVWAFALLPVALSLVVSAPGPAGLLAIATWLLAFDAGMAAERCASLPRRAARRRRERALHGLLLRVPLPLCLGAQLLLLRPWLAFLLVPAALVVAGRVLHRASAVRPTPVLDVATALTCASLAWAIPAVAADAAGGWVPPATSGGAALVAALGAAALLGSTLHVRGLAPGRGTWPHTIARVYALLTAGAACVAAVLGVYAGRGELVWLFFPAVLMLERALVLTPSSETVQRWSRTRLLLVEAACLASVVVAAALVAG